MKIRTDFVTNSSSSNFVAMLKFIGKDGKELSYSETHRAKYIEAGINLHNLEEESFSTVAELCNVLNLKARDSKFYYNVLRTFKSLDDIEKIEHRRGYCGWGSEIADDEEDEEDYEDSDEYSDDDYEDSDEDSDEYFDDDYEDSDTTVSVSEDNWIEIFDIEKREVTHKEN